MIPQILVRFNDQALHEAASRYGLQTEQLKPIGGFESFVYEYERDGQFFILKITHEIRRSVNYLMGEIEWLNFLAEQGITVCQCIPSLGGNFVEVIPDGSSDDGLQFLAISYIKAMGHHPNADDWNSGLFVKLGELVGRIHNATRQYQVSRAGFKRQEWYEEEQFKARKYLPDTDSDVVEFIESRMEELRKLPRDIHSYGLVHADIGYPNFFVANESIQLFDFDDIGYYYFIHDMAIVMYHALNYPPKKPQNLTDYVATFLEQFMEGYSKHHQLERFWLTYLPDFIDLRHGLQYVIFHQAFDPSSLDDNGRAMLEQHRKEVVEGTETARIVRELIKTKM